MEMYKSYWESNDDKSAEWRDGLMKWHNKRSRDILVTIVESDFGNRVQKLRIDAGTEGQENTLASLMRMMSLFLKFAGTANFALQTY